MIDLATINVSADAVLAWPVSDGYQQGGALTISTDANGPSVYVGPAGVATSSGFPIPAGGSLSMDLGIGDALYAVAEHAATVRIIATTAGAA